MPTSVLPASGSPALDWAARSMPLLAATMAATRRRLRRPPRGHLRAHRAEDRGARCTGCSRVGPRVTSPATSARPTRRPSTRCARSARRSSAVTATMRRSTRATSTRSSPPNPTCSSTTGRDDRADPPRRPAQRTFLGATEETRRADDDSANSTSRGLPGHRHQRQPAETPDRERVRRRPEHRAGFMNATNAMLPGTRATVIGYGPCGKGVAETLARLGARVSVADTHPYRASRRSCTATRRPSRRCLPESQLVILAIGVAGVISAISSICSATRSCSSASARGRRVGRARACRREPISMTCSEPVADVDAASSYEMARRSARSLCCIGTMIELVAAGGKPDPWPIGPRISSRRRASPRSRGAADSRGPRGVLDRHRSGRRDRAASGSVSGSRARSGRRCRWWGSNPHALSGKAF